MRLRFFAFTALFFLCLTVFMASPLSAAGKLQLRYEYTPPGDEDPTYHTVIWLETEDGKFVQTLFVTAELAGTEYKLGDVCPDWVKQANWEKADKSMADAVTNPTPQVGMGGLEFNLDVPPGKYVVKYEVHVIREYNILFTGHMEVGGPEQEMKVETRYNPSKLEIGAAVVDQVRMTYVP